MRMSFTTVSLFAGSSVTPFSISSYEDSKLFVEVTTAKCLSSSSPDLFS